MNQHVRIAAGVTAVLVAVVGLVACTGDDDPKAKEGGGSSQLSAPVVGSYVIDGGTENPQDIRVAVHGVRRIEGATVLDWSVTPLESDSVKKGDPVGQKIDIDVTPALGNSQALNLIDTAAQRVYRPLDNDPRESRGEQVAGCLCIRWSQVEDDLEVGTTVLMQAAFPELPHDLEDISVSLRNQPLVAEVPIADIGSVYTGPKVDLAAPAGELPAASEPQQFLYPVEHAVKDPEQKMSLVVNEVLASTTGTSLVFTVTAEGDGDALDATGGAPLGDHDIVQYGTQLFGTSADGPGIRVSGDADATVTRAWFAQVSQRTRKPRNAPGGFVWRECLCSHTQFYGDVLSRSGRSRTFVAQMASLPAGADKVDVVFPDASLPAAEGIDVTKVETAAVGEQKKVSTGTWSFPVMGQGDPPDGWPLDKWPTPVPDVESVGASSSVIDVLEAVTSDDASVERKESDQVEVTLDSTVTFEPDSAKLTSKAMATIMRIAKDLDQTAEADTHLMIVGHVSGTDRGSETVQKKLSTDRAQAVGRALDSLITADIEITAVGKGAAEPVAPNDSEENRKLNRRVVLTYDR